MIGEISVYKNEDGFRFRLADEWAWSPADSFKDAQDGLLDDYRLEELEEAWDVEQSRQGKYFVRLPDAGVTYPKSGNEHYPDGYPLKKALDFARIGSQQGGPREVRREKRSGPRVRTYKKGKRVWPATRAQAKRLLPAEVPQWLRAN